MWAGRQGQPTRECDRKTEGCRSQTRATGGGSSARSQRSATPSCLTRRADLTFRFHFFGFSLGVLPVSLPRWRCLVFPWPAYQVTSAVILNSSPRSLMPRFRFPVVR